MPQTVAIIGATGGIGSFVVTQCLEKGYIVKVLVRDQAKLESKIGVANVAKIAKIDKNNIIIGDVKDMVTLEKVVFDTDIILSCIGVPSGSKEMIVEPGTKNIIQAMKKAGCCKPTCRLALISSIGVNRSYPQMCKMSWLFAYILVPYVIANLFKDLKLAEDYCFGSDNNDNNDIDSNLGERILIVRPPGLADKKVMSGYVTKAEDDLFNLNTGDIGRIDVGMMMCDLVDMSNFHKIKEKCKGTASANGVSAVSLNSAEKTKSLFFCFDSDHVKVLTFLEMSNDVTIFVVSA